MKNIIITLLFLSYFLITPITYSEDNNSLDQFQSNRDQFSVGIYPPILEVKANPPAEIESKINLENLSTISRVFDISVRSIKSSFEGDGTIVYEDEDSINEPELLIRDKITIYDDDIPLQEVSLDALEAKELKLKISLDKDTEIGDYYFSILFTASTKGSNTTGSEIPGGISTNLILSIGQTGEATSGEIKEFKVPSIISSGPVPITLSINNKSDHFILPSGRVNIKDMFGRDAGQLNILPQYILANSFRYMTDTNHILDTQEMSAPHPTIIWPEKFLFGLYTVYAQVKLSETGPVFETQSSFIALPFYLLFAVSFVVFVLISIYLKTKKKI